MAENNKEDKIKKYDSVEEELYRLYIEMRKKTKVDDSFSYNIFEKPESEEFKDGFLCGVRIARSVFKEL